MTEGHGDGWIAAQRCLAAMAETTDVETRASLWRAACRYMHKERMERAARLESQNRSLPRALGGEVLAREGVGE